MKRVVFIRHGQLAPPYHDYLKLSFQQLAELGRQDVDPPIDVNIFSYEGPNLDGIDAVYRATSLRCHQTTQQLVGDTYTGIIEERKELNEVYFDLEKLLTEAEYIQHGFQRVRESIFDGIVRSKEGVDSVYSIIDTLKTLRELLESSQSNNILCVTHGFLMRFLEVSFRYNKPLEKLTAEDLLSYTNYGYAKGFEIQL